MWADLACKNRAQMTYKVLSGTLSLYPLTGSPLCEQSSSMKSGLGGDEMPGVYPFR